MFCNLDCFMLINNKLYLCLYLCSPVIVCMYHMGLWSSGCEINKLVKLVKLQPEHPYDNNSIYQGTSYDMKERKFISKTSSMIHKYILAKHFLSIYSKTIDHIGNQYATRTTNCHIDTMNEDTLTREDELCTSSFLLTCIMYVHQKGWLNYWSGIS